MTGNDPQALVTSDSRRSTRRVAKGRIAKGRMTKSAKPTTCCLFPGQGSQAKGMGKALFDAFPTLVRIADGILGYSVRALCLEDPQRELGQTRFSQPALFVVNAL